MKKFLPLVLCLLISLPACTAQPAQTSQLQIALGYIPNVQFAPMYVAIENGYFADAGLDAEIVHMDETQAAALVGAGELQFAVVSGEQVLLARSQGLPIVYVAAWYQQYPVSLVSRSDLGITAPADLRGQTIGLPGLYGANYIGLRALLHAGGLTEADVVLESIGYAQVESFAAGRNPVICGYAANEPVQLRAQGYDVNELRVADYVQLAANGIITSEKTIAENPALVRRMVDAFLRGLSDTIADPEAAYQISMGYVEGLAADDAVQMQVLETSIELWQAEELGHTDAAAWENMQTVLLDMGLLTGPLEVSEAFTNEFLP